MQTVAFQGTSYTTEVLETFNRQQLSDLYNKVRDVTIPDSKAIKIFKTKGDAVARTWNLLREFGHQQVDVDKPKAEKAKGKRRMHFVYPYHGDENLKKIQSEDSLRGRAAAKLKDGASFEEIVEVVKQFDRDRGHGPGNQERRAYEVIRLLHYYIGYGLKQDEAGKIYTHTTPPGQR